MNARATPEVAFLGFPASEPETPGPLCTISLACSIMFHIYVFAYDMMGFICCLLILLLSYFVLAPCAASACDVSRLQLQRQRGASAKLIDEIGPPRPQLEPQIISLGKCNVSQIVLDTPVY